MFDRTLEFVDDLAESQRNRFQIGLNERELLGGKPRKHTIAQLFFGFWLSGNIPLLSSGHASKRS